MAFKMKGMDHGEGTGSAFPNVGKTGEYSKSAAFQYDKFDVLKGKDHLEKIKLNKKNTKSKKTTKKKFGPITGKIGSELRRKQYDERGWAYDDTINVVKKKKGKGAHKPPPQTITRKDPSTDYDPSKRNKKMEGYIPYALRK
jgi:hypothetical protein